MVFRVLLTRRVRLLAFVATTRRETFWSVVELPPPE